MSNINTVIQNVITSTVKTVEGMKQKGVPDAIIINQGTSSKTPTEKSPSKNTSN